jgi:uncharacterized protein YndB with AHSA1/START domain
MDVNRNAPALAEAETYINAPVELVWQVQSAIESWPSWNRKVESVHMEGPLQPGTTFRWKSGANIISVLQEVTPSVRIGWTGKAFGIRALHIWEFKGQDGTTHVKTAESFDGWLAKLFPGLMRKTLRDSLKEAIASLKTECERRLMAGKT